MRRMSHHLVEPPPPLPDPTRDVLVTTVSLPLSRSWIRGDRGNSSLVPLILFSGLLENTLSFWGHIFYIWWHNNNVEEEVPIFWKWKLWMTWQQRWGGGATIWFHPHLPSQIQLEMCLWRQSACHLVGAGSGGIGVILHWFPWFYSLVSWRILCLFLVIFFYIWWHNNIEEDEVPIF